MKIATTTDNFAFYCNNDLDRIRELHKAGFRYIDLSMYSLTPNSPYMGENWKEAVQELKNEAERLNMKFVQAHSQGGNVLGPDREKADFILRSTIRSIEICGELGIPNTVVHPGSGQGFTKEEWFEKNKGFYQQLFPAMEKTGVNVLIENNTKANTKDKYWANSAADMVEFLRYVDHPLLHACWDTGHANCEGAQYNEIQTLGKELYAIHYNDNHGLKDDHVAPVLGRLNHDEVMSALVDVGFKGPFTLECDSSLIKYNCWVGKRRRFGDGERELRLSEPQLFMQRHIEAMMYETAKWMLSSYGIEGR